ILGSGYLATVIAAIEAGADDGRRVDLLLDAVSGRVTPALVMSAVARGASFAPRLVEKLFSGAISLAPGGLAALALELSICGRTDRGPAAPAPLPADVRALVEAGWNDTKARALLERARTTPLAGVEMEALRGFFREWLTLAEDTSDPT